MRSEEASRVVSKVHAPLRSPSLEGFAARMVAPSPGPSQWTRGEMFESMFDYSIKMRRTRDPAAYYIE